MVANHRTTVVVDDDESELATVPRLVHGRQVEVQDFSEVLGRHSKQVGALLGAAPWQLGPGTDLAGQSLVAR